MPRTRRPTSRILDNQPLYFVADGLLLVSFTWIGLHHLAIDSALMKSPASEGADDGKDCNSSRHLFTFRDYGYDMPLIA